MPRSGGQSEARPPVFKSPNKLGTHLSTHCTDNSNINYNSQCKEGCGSPGDKKSAAHFQGQRSCPKNRSGYGDTVSFLSKIADGQSREEKVIRGWPR
ncbi:hypothetical protein TNCV_2067861 [Trichonephila clavipes]|uniref:Uncharacterized protein n=1 Tax=Trichonephila clavipes TaxID=2585209 RepID=A0A8X7BD07_TRICX|nr:hypothetical protein TNCV_2067861 [Trichonephila clavipes]